MDSLPTGAPQRLDLRDARGTGAIVFDPVRWRQAGPDGFDPGHYGERAQPVASGGRGAAWFVRNGFGEAVLRHYRRGGWAARLSRDAYLWRGEASVRSVAEFALMRRLRALELPVPAPIAAAYWRRGVGYRAALLVARIPGARPLLAAAGGADGAEAWLAAGRAVGRCHRAGAHHADLNADNLLLDGQGAAWLIDWDKGRIESGPGPWCEAVLARLARSLRKLGLAEAQLTAGMATLRAAHDRELAA